MAEFRALVKLRSRIRARLTAFNNFISRVSAEPEKGRELAVRIEKAEGLWTEFDTIQSKIEDLEDTEEQTQERQDFEDAYFQLITAARGLQVSERAPTPRSHQPLVAQLNAGVEQLTPGSFVRLPHIELPKFDGSYERWISFRDLFESLIASNVSISAVQKLYYLRSALTGEAAKVITSLEITNNNYEVAWNSLKQRFENKKLIVQHLIHTVANLPQITRESYAELRQFADNVSQSTQNLTKLGQPVEHWGTLFLYYLLPKIDRRSRREWNLQRSTTEEFPTLNEFISFLMSRSAFLEANRDMQFSVDSRSNNKTSQGQNKNISRSYVASNRLSCSLCSDSHMIHECRLFLNMSVADRSMEVRKKRLCIKCLREYHGKNCKVSECGLCKGYHNSLLHRPKVSTAEMNNGIKSSYNESPSNSARTNNLRPRAAALSAVPSSVSFNHCSMRGPSQVLLSTAILFIYDSHGVVHKCRALLDSGSQSNFITRQLSNKLRLRYKNIDKTIMGISDRPINAIQQVDATIQSRTSAYQVRLPFVIIDKITERLPTTKINKNSLNIPHDLRLADPSYHIPGDIDFLLGASIFWELLGRKQIRLSRNAPILQETLLGWLISGNVRTNCTQQHRTYCGISTNARIQTQLEKFWHIEEVRQPEHHSQEEIQCEDHFVITHSRNVEGRFVIQLPLKDGVQNLGAFHEIAERLKSLERKLERQPEIKQQYHEFMREYIELNHMTEIPANEINSELAYYIPHHAVMKEDSETTKLRVVFDASCKTTSGQSLNDFLKIGPHLQQELLDIIIRLRQHKYALAADITKMYRQIEVAKEHRSLQRILWRWSRDEPIRTFDLNTVTYGMSSSSFVAVRCLQETAHQLKQHYPQASEIILRDFYVDDLLTGANSVEELKKLKHDVVRILSSARFELSKWKSNALEINNKSDISSATVRLGETTKILGLRWNTTTDTFHYHVKPPHDKEKITKRNILSRIAGIYDPLGWISPVVVRAKIILQRLWQMNKAWDEDITGDTCTMWTQWKTQIIMLEDITIPRRVLCDSPGRIELHGFCNASEVAYGACMYLRSIDSEGRYTVRLVCAKSRVAPIKRISLPRLELCEATLLAHLSQRVSQALSIQPNAIYYWSDSMIALSWISSEASKWHTFVANRVAEIHHITNGAPWYHVKSENNPADPLRGANPEKMKLMRLWWEGPDFLHHDASLYPFGHESICKNAPEARVISLVVQDAIIEADSSIIQRFSSLTRLKRVIAYLPTPAYASR